MLIIIVYFFNIIIVSFGFFNITVDIFSLLLVINILIFGIYKLFYNYLMFVNVKWVFFCVLLVRLRV